MMKYKEIYLIIISYLQKLVEQRTGVRGVLVQHLVDVAQDFDREITKTKLRRL